MTANLFGATFAVAAPFWALMILLPRWSWTTRIVASPLIVVPVLVIYGLLVVPALDTVLPVVASPTLDGVQVLLGTAVGASAAWAHMIAFDLFVGRWAWLDSRDRGVPRRPQPTPGGIGERPGYDTGIRTFRRLPGSPPGLRLGSP